MKVKEEIFSKLTPEQKSSLRVSRAAEISVVNSMFENQLYIQKGTTPSSNDLTIEEDGGAITIRERTEYPF
ncbi:hypothetical protein QCD71_25060, partial [Sphingomonas sp. PsM26]|nr:hypothetical protein [Sphingomonas sp. PsM26]